MEQFLSQLKRPERHPPERQWTLVLYDQLHADLGLLRTLPPQEVGIVLVESDAFYRRRPYHKQKLAYMIASQRQLSMLDRLLEN